MKLVNTLIAALAVTAISVPLSYAKNDNLGIEPIEPRPFKSYAELAAEWWKWALGTSDINHMVNHPGNDSCAAGQPEGNVWFLGTTLGRLLDDSDPAERYCYDVPSGKFLFIPLINSFGFLAPGEPGYPEEGDDVDKKVTNSLRRLINCKEPSELSVTIDGDDVKNPNTYLVNTQDSPVFTVVVPTGGLFGDETVLKSAVAYGYHLLLHPLEPGEHEIKWNAAWTCPFGDFTENIIYSITVVDETPQ